MGKSQSALEFPQEGPNSGHPKEMGSENLTEGTLNLEFSRQKRKKWDSRRGNSVKQKEIIPSFRRENGNKLQFKYLFSPIKYCMHSQTSCHTLSHCYTQILSLDKYLWSQRFC